MNSGADLKAFVGEHGGAVCTSGNAEPAFRWALAEGDAVLFFPDEHLGRNTGSASGSTTTPASFGTRAAPSSAASIPRPLADTPLILWKGFCNVHTTFTPAQIAKRAPPTRMSGSSCTRSAPTGRGRRRRGRVDRVHHPTLR